MDIIIYTTPETLEHKRSPDSWCYWTLRSFPKHIKECDKVFFAVKGFIRGYFEIQRVSRELNEIEWDTQTWKDIDPIPTKSFQGFKYFREDDKLKKEIEK